MCVQKHGNLFFIWFIIDHVLQEQLKDEKDACQTWRFDNEGESYTRETIYKQKTALKDASKKQYNLKKSKHKNHTKETKTAGVHWRNKKSESNMQVLSFSQLK